MADPHGFQKYSRHDKAHRPVPLRLLDWHEVYEKQDLTDLRQQATRCMDCGIPFCHDGCPLGNIIPEWNDLVRLGWWREAFDRLHATNNFPEFTGRLCPAPCEGACVLGINDDPVTIKNVELEIVEYGFEHDFVKPVRPSFSTGQSVAVVGSGPAGLAAAQQLTRAGHDVTVFERHDRLGGLMRYGVPEYKMEKKWINRRLEQMVAEGTQFRTNLSPSVSDLQGFDAVVLAIGSTIGRDLPIEGRDLEGVYQAMEYLPEANKVQEGDRDVSTIDAHGKNVVIVGGGDTGTDCFGTALRQGAKSVVQFDIGPKPPRTRAASTPWPTFPRKLRVASAHEEGEYGVSGEEEKELVEKLGLDARVKGHPLGNRQWKTNTVEFIGSDGKITGLKGTLVDRTPEGTIPIEGSDFEIDADLVLLAMGFASVDRAGIVDELGLEIDGRGRIVRDEHFRAEVPLSAGFRAPVFVAGDAGRGQSLIVWGISEGRSAAAAVDRQLMGESSLPAAIVPTDVPMRA